jgi:DDE family transposase/transposase-like protein DUF772
MENRLFELLTQFGQILQGKLFPRLEDELGPLTDRHRQLVTVLGLANVEAMIPRRGLRVGRPQQDRGAIARSFVAKAIWNLATTRALIELLKADTRLRRICGWERATQVPDETIFSRAFAGFAQMELPQRVHEALIAKTQKERLIGHISRDSTAIKARERAVKPAGAAKPAGVPERRPKPTEPKKPKPMTRLERQTAGMTLAQMLADLPRHCSIGVKRNSQGLMEKWRGYKLHIDVADGQIPISAMLTAATLHDSQAAIPLATITAQRVTSLYDLMDSAYDSRLIRQYSRSLNHVPIIERVERRNGVGIVPFIAHEAARYKERTAVERVNGRLKDEFGGRQVRVRGAVKIMTHLMFGLVALTVDEILRLCT